MEAFNSFLETANAYLWHDNMLYLIVGVGVLFTVTSFFGQFRSLTHGAKVLRGAYDDPNDPGAINHFQALSGALSATVGLGNIGGVALAISLGGPGAVFWMWIIGFLGMAIKLTEVTQSMLYRNTDDPNNPHGGPMWVASKGMARMSPKLAWLGSLIGGVFCIMLLISTTTGGNMFQAWNVAELGQTYFGIDGWITGIIMSVLVGLVIIGGINRIGKVAGFLVPFMVGLYLIAGTFVLIKNAGAIPDVFRLIFHSAFNPTEATGAFVGGTMASALLFGMKRAIFSNEAGQGSSPVIHSAAKTDEPVREGLVAGLEPFIDTIVVCTFTAVIILSTGVWNRGADGEFTSPPAIIPVGASQFSINDTPAPASTNNVWQEGQTVFMFITGDQQEKRGNNLHQLFGNVFEKNGQMFIDWNNIEMDVTPQLQNAEVFVGLTGATLTARAFDSAAPGLGKWLVSIASLMFALSTMISWSYYGEQCIVYLMGNKAVLTYKFVYCLLIVVATLGFIENSRSLDNLTSFGTGVAVLANIPIMLIFGRQAIRAYHNYFKRVKSGQAEPGANTPAPSIDDIIDGKA
ncbi:MAG: alanine/glycine:cation symporter family protein [Gammaproteobacteria bacterium]